MTSSLQEQRGKKLFALFFVLALASTFGNWRPASAQTTNASSTAQQDLQTKIQQKTADLDKINQQLEAARQQLESTRSQRVGLQQDLSQLQSNINQLQLSIQADNVTSQKLGLEVDSLSYDIRDTELSIEDKRKAISKILLTLQQNDNVSPLFILLKNNSLADSVLENQSLQNLKQQLTLDISNLDNLHQSLSDKIDQTKQKQTDIEFHKQSAAARQAIIEDQKQERSVILTQTKNKESTYQQQYDELVKQQNAIEDEISQIEDQLRAQFNPDLLPTARHGLLAWPVQMSSQGGAGRITQHYGEVSSLYHGKPHNGLDIGVPIGTPIFAVADGTVWAVDNNDQSSWRHYQYGKYVLIKHDNNLTTIYGHMSRQVVKAGQTVKQGDLIGYSGATGYATGPHLHLGLYYSPSVYLKSIPPAAGLVPVGVTINPEDYLADLP